MTRTGGSRVRTKRMPGGDTEPEFVVGITRRDEIANPGDIEILSGQGSVMAGFKGSEEALMLAIEELRQEIMKKRDGTKQ